MSETWTDEFFLGYVETHSATDRALFSPEHAERLYRLAGFEPFWQGPKRFVALHEDAALPLVRLARLSPLGRFYSGSGVDSADRTFENILAFDDDQMEKTHDYIQWLFPNPEPSQWNPQAPLLSEKDILDFKKDPGLREQSFKAFTRWMDFMEASSQWCTPRNHNHLRITRIIRFLTLTEQSNEGGQVYHTACGMMEKHCGDYFPATTESFWKEARNLKPAWLTETS
tara:strand:- start:2649 stop:3329 length:681 start_codon:yes stop_codon:yes gene_type:complete